MTEETSLVATILVNVAFVLHIFAFAVSECPCGSRAARAHACALQGSCGGGLAGSRAPASTAPSLSSPLPPPAVIGIVSEEIKSKLSAVRHGNIPL